MLNRFMFLFFFVSFFCSLNVWAAPNRFSRMLADPSLPPFMREQLEQEHKWYCEYLLNRAKKLGIITPQEEPSEAKRIEWAKAFAAESKHSADILVDSFELVEIHDQQAFIDIAKIIARQSGWRVAHFLSIAKIVDEKVRIELAKQVASGEESDHLPSQIDKYEIQDQKFLVELVTELFAKHPGLVGQSFANFKIQDEAIRIRFAKDYAAYREWAMSRMISEFDLHDQPTLIEIVSKNAMREDNEVAYWIRDFRIESVDERIKIAKILAQSKPIDLMRNFEHFEIANEEDRFEIAKIAFSSKEHSMAEYIHVFDLPSEGYRVELAKISALLHPYQLSRFISFFKISSDAALTDIAKIVALQNPKIIAEYIQQFIIQTEALRFELAKIVAAEQSTEISAYLLNFEIENPEYNLAIARIAAPTDAYFSTNIQSYKDLKQKDRLELAKVYAASFPQNAIQHIRYFDLDESGYEEVIRVAASTNGVITYYTFINLRKSGHPFSVPRFTHAFLESALRSPHNKSIPSNQRWDHYSVIGASEGMEAVKPYLGEDPVLIALYAQHIEFAHNENNPLPHLSEILKLDELGKFIPALSDRSRHAEVQTKLFQQIWKIMRGDQQKYKTRLEARIDSLNVLEIALGLKEHSLDGWAQLSNDRRNTFYELALEIAELQPGIFLDSPNIRALLTKKQNEYILGLIRDNLTLGPSPELTEILKLTDDKQLGEQLKILFSDRMKKLFSDLNLSISYAEFLPLKEKWENLEPVLTLMARFKGSHHWQSELPWLGHVFSAEIRNQFHELKFSQALDEKDARLLASQLEFLTEEQKSEWQKIRQVAQVFDMPAPGTPSGMEKVRRLHTMVPMNDQLMTHLKDVLLNSRKHEFDKSIKTAFIKKQDPTQTLDELREKFDHFEILSALLSSLEEFSLESDLKEYKSLLIFLSANADELIKYTTDREQIKEDVKGLLLYLRDPEQGKSGDKIIVYTTLIQDAKNLLTIGDLVEASSCQNYKTGSHVETLLGYVLDANVQGIVSFAVTKSHFKSEKEFVSAYESIKNNPDAIRFDPYAHTFTIQTPAGQIQSLPVKKAHFRQMLKLGRTEAGKPGLRLERAYQQHHAAQSLMAKQTQDLMNDVSSAIGAEAGEITIPQSRNPGGVYSDACSGVMNQSYKIQ